MSRIRILRLLSVAAAVAVGFAAYEMRRAAVARAGDRVLAGHRTELEAQFRSAERELLGVRRARESLEQKAAMLAASPLAATSTADSGGVSPSGGRSAWFAGHSEARANYLRAVRDGLSTTWGLLFKSLNLSPDQENKLQDLLAEREANNITVEAAAQAKGLDESAPEIQALDDQLDAANKAAIRQLLGKAGYDAVRDYRHAEEVIPVVDQLAASVYNMAEPLTGDEAMALTRVLADSSQKNDSGRVIGGTVNWDQAMVRAQAILSPAQIGALANLKEQAQAQGELNRITSSLSSPPAQ